MTRAEKKYYIRRLVSINNEINFLHNFELQKTGSFFIKKNPFGREGKLIINIAKFMKKKFSILALGALLFVLGASVALAGPPDKTDGFVCPVIKTENVMHSPKAQAIGGGHYTIIGPNVHIPIHATNGDGTGTPPGPHSAPGDTDYTAIWATP